MYESTIADPEGGGAPAPPNGRGPMIFYAQNAKFSQFFFARYARDYFLSIILIEIWQNTLKMTFTLTFNTFNDFLPR